MRPGGRTPSSARTGRVRVDAFVPSLACPHLPLRTQSAVRADGLRPHGRGRSKFFIFYFLFFKYFILFFRSCGRLEKRKIKIKKRFSVFNPQDPCAPRALQAKPQEEEGFFGLVPLVTHPSSIPLFGGLTPKFLSLSLHSL
jgi:hypothetical protein